MLHQRPKKTNEAVTNSHGDFHVIVQFVIIVFDGEDAVKIRRIAEALVTIYDSRVRSVVELQSDSGSKDAIEPAFER